MFTIDSTISKSGSNNVFEDIADLHNIVNSFDNPYHYNISGDYFKSLYSHPMFDLANDLVLVRDSLGNLIGSGSILSHDATPTSSRVTIQIHPEHRLQGIGSNILEHLVQTCVNIGSTDLYCRVFNFRPYANSFVLYHGFVSTTSWIKMQYQLNSRTHPTHLPWNLKIRAINPKRELDLWAQLQNDIFTGSSQYEDVTTASLKALIDNKCFDPNLLIVGEVGERPVGYCFGWSVSSNNEGKKEKILQIQGLGVLPEFQGKGHATSLLLEIMNRAYLKGHSNCELLVLSNNEPAINLYRKMGFKEQYRHQWYRCKV